MLGSLARPEGFEPPTLGSEVRCSVQLSYGRVPKTLIKLTSFLRAVQRHQHEPPRLYLFCT